MRELLAAIDFSPVSKTVVEQAASLAETFSAELTVIHVAPLDPEFVIYAPGPQTVRDVRALEMRAEHRELQEIADRLRDGGVSVRSLLIRGPAVGKILAEGHRLEADLIVIGSHGHGALYRALLGSVSEGIVRTARCPILVRTPTSSGSTAPTARKCSVPISSIS